MTFVSWLRLVPSHTGTLGRRTWQYYCCSVSLRCVGSVTVSVQTVLRCVTCETDLAVEKSLPSSVDVIGLVCLRALLVPFVC